MGYNFVIGKEKALGNSTVKWYACNFEILGLPDIVWPISISRFATIWACSVAESLSLQIGTLCYPPTQASPKYKSVTSVNMVLRLPDLCKPKAAQKIRRNKSTAEWCALFLPFSCSSHDTFLCSPVEVLNMMSMLISW